MEHIRRIGCKIYCDLYELVLRFRATETIRQCNYNETNNNLLIPNKFFDCHMGSAHETLSTLCIIIVVILLFN